MVFRGGVRSYFWWSAECKKIMAVWNFCSHRTIWGWKFQNTTPPTVFIQSHPKCMRTLITRVGGYRLLLFFIAINSKAVYHLEKGQAEHQGPLTSCFISKKLIKCHYYVHRVSYLWHISLFLVQHYLFISCTCLRQQSYWCRHPFLGNRCIDPDQILYIERNGWKFGTHGPRNCICRYFSCMSSVWGHSVHLAKFLMLRYSEGYCSHTFAPI